MIEFFFHSQALQYLVPEAGTKRLVFKESNPYVAGTFSLQYSMPGFGPSPSDGKYAIFSNSANAYVTIAEDGYLAATLPQSPLLDANPDLNSLFDFNNNSSYPNFFTLVSNAGPVVLNGSYLSTVQSSGEVASVALQMDVPRFLSLKFVVPPDSIS